MRIFCGLANVNEAVAAALVNERGGVVATAEVTDDPHGFLALCHMWVRHAELPGVTVADDGSTTALLRFAAAAGQPVATDAPGPVDTHDGLEIAVHIARLLSSGALPTLIGGTSDAPASMRNLLGASHALTNSRHASRAALVELLRRCHPAVLMAWDDPTDEDALALLRVLPDPCDAATADPAELVGALRQTADPRTIGTLVQSLSEASRALESVPDPGVAEAIVAAIDAVTACDRSLDAIATSLAAQVRPARRRKAPEPVTEKLIPAPRRAPAVEPVATKPQPTPPVAKPAPKPAPAPAVEPIVPAQSPPGRTPLNRFTRRGDSPATNNPPVMSPPVAMTPPQSLSQPHGEPLTVPIEPHTPTHGFPRMPEPPSFVEPLTSHLVPRPTAQSGPDLLSAPVSELPGEIDAADDDLLIFSQARSAWFKGPAAIDDAEGDWSTPADIGWRAAAAAANSQETPKDTTGSGLPRRVPQANLVPGSAILGEAKPAPIKRDASTLASHTSGYFRGWSRARRETVGAGTR